MTHNERGDLITALMLIEMYWHDGNKENLSAAHSYVQHVVMPEIPRSDAALMVVSNIQAHAAIENAQFQTKNSP
tara:strand:+ start:761 stop:982 length:222 start_codon:yes stop_codon:yes gene_type:complete